MTTKTTTKIQKLTPEQETRLKTFREEWLQVGLSTELADHARAEAAVTEMYSILGKKRPMFLWFSSPCLAIFAIGLLRLTQKTELWAQLGAQLGDQLGDQLGTQLGDQLGAQLGAQLRAQLGAQLRDQLGDQLWYQLWDQLGTQLGDQLGDQLWHQLWHQLWDQLGTQLGDQLWYQLWDQLWDQLGAQLRTQLGAQLRDQLGDQLWAQLGAQLRDQLGDQLWDQLGAQLRAQLGDQLRAQLGAQLRAQLGAQLGDQLRAQLRDLTWRNIWGQQEAYWIAFYLFGLEIGVMYREEDARRLNLWVEGAKSTHWWWPFDGVCVLSERPETLSLESMRRNANLLQLHSDNGPAIGYRDGWGVYSVHGVRVPADVFEKPESLTAERVLSERNAEIRRVMVDKMGRDRFFAEAKPVVLHEDVDGAGQPRRLLRIDLRDDEAFVAVEVTCPGTGRRYINRVRPDVQTCHEAVASRWGVTPEQYQPIEEA